MSSVLAGAPAGAAVGPEPGSPPPHPPGMAPDQRPRQRNTALTIIAGVGVLLLAMGVGVLIGRAGVGKQSPGPAQVITVDQGGAAAQTGAGTEAAFTSDWPAGTKGFTVQLQTLPSTSTVSAVEAAKTAATAKGASAVGALKAEEFSSLSSTGFVIYSGDYHTRALAQKALPALKRSFPGASVVEVSSGSSKSSSSTSPSGSSGGANLNHPASPSVIKSNHAAGSGKGSGKNYEEESAKLPDVVETG